MRASSVNLEKDAGLRVVWSDGVESYYEIGYLRRMSPSADARQQRESLEKNPLTVLPGGAGVGELRAEGAELVGNYGLRIRFSDGHDTGIYSWRYLREIDPGAGGGG